MQCPSLIYIEELEQFSACGHMPLLDYVVATCLGLLALVAPIKKPAILGRLAERVGKVIIQTSSQI